MRVIREVDDGEYCIYEGRRLPSTELSDEHIIPLALGGVDALMIRASAKFNSDVGTELEGKLAGELAMCLRRNEFDVRGHSGKRPVPTYKSGLVEGLEIPVHVQLDKRDRALHLFSPRDGRFLEDHESAGRRISFSTTVDTTIRCRFAAKVAMGAGYFVYGDKFVECAQVDDLRALVLLDEDNMSGDLQVIDNLFGDLSKQQKIVRTLGRIAGLSSVVVMPSENDITFVVTCLKEFCGLLRVRADTSALPDKDQYKWGHVLACDGKVLRRDSLHRGLSLLRDLVANKSEAH